MVCGSMTARKETESHLQVLGDILGNGSCLKHQREIRVNKQCCTKENRIYLTGNTSHVHEILDDYMERAY